MSYFKSSYQQNEIIEDWYGRKYKVTTGGTTPSSAFNPNNVVNDEIVWGDLRLTPVTTESGSSSGGGLSYWAASTSYAVDDIVVYDDKIYRCSTAHTSSSTFDDTKWTEISASSSSSSVDNNTVALLHFDTYPITDECDNYWIPSTNEVLTKANKKFGKRSFNVANSKYISTTEIDIDNLLNNDFTIEFWYYTESNANDASIFSFDGSDVYGFLFNTQRANAWLIAARANNSWITLGTFAPIYNDWTHIAVVRNDDDIIVFQNGNSVLTYQNIGTINTSNNKRVLFGTDALTRCFNGLLDEFRVSNIARYTSAFTPPSAPFTYSSNNGGGV